MTTLPPSIVHDVGAVLLRNLRVWRRYFFSQLVGNLAEPLLSLIALGYGLGALVPRISGMSYIEFIAPGLIISAAMYAATFEGTFGTFTRLEPQHTFEGILSTPVGVTEITIAEILYASIKAFLAGTAVLIIVACFGLVGSPLAIAVPLLTLLCGIIFGGLAVLFASASPSYDFFNYYFTLVVTPIFLFSGIFFPLDQLPSWVQSVAWFSPLTHAVDASRALFIGRLDRKLALDIIWLMVVAPVPIVPAIWLFHRRLIK
jgi:lipooligosaccharide transport system permease protein